MMAGFFETGGAREDRTPDLLIANQSLSQLSYDPLTRNFLFYKRPAVSDGPFAKLVELRRIELLTS